MKDIFCDVEFTSRDPGETTRRTGGWGKTDRIFTTGPHPSVHEPLKPNVDRDGVRNETLEPVQ